MSRATRRASVEVPACQRLDVWLFRARLCKSRALAGRLVTAGHVRLNRRKVKRPAAILRPEDVLTVVHHGRVRVLRVIALPARRGPAREAAASYEEL